MKKCSQKISKDDYLRIFKIANGIEGRKITKDELNKFNSVYNELNIDENDLKKKSNADSLVVKSMLKNLAYK